MHRNIIFVILLGVALCAPAIAQQDPDDPGAQDSLIVGNGAAGAYCDNYQVIALGVSAVTDDPINFYNLPLRAYAPSAGISFDYHNQYFYPLTMWDVAYDSFFAAQNLLRQFGIAECSHSRQKVKLLEYKTRDMIS